MEPVSVKPTLKTLIPRTKVVAALMLLPLLLATPGKAQGTLTFTFDDAPPGTTYGPFGVYTNQGMQFGMAYGPGSLYLSGGGIPGYPDNGTGYLEIPDGIPGGNGDTRFEFGFNAFYQVTRLVPFNLVSFDAAVFANLGPQSLEVVGYHPMAGTSTNYFTVTGQTFQTYYLDSSFANVFKVDVFNARWSLDNLVISGVPEPSAPAIFAAASASALALSRLARNRRKI
jgi:hypothetical protein